MNDREREHISRIVVHGAVTRQRALADRINRVFAEHAAKGALHSGATVRVSIRVMHDAADELLSDVAPRVRAVAEGKEAFELLAKGVNGFLDHCASELLPPLVKMASGRGRDTPEPSITQAADKLFDDVRADIEAKLDILAFDFDKPIEPPAPPNETQSVASEVPAIGKGGRPPAPFWDDMWAAIAAALYGGELAPKTQADIEKAMADWIELNGHSAGESTIRGRARRLWDRISGLTA